MEDYYFPYITPRRRNAARYRRLYETQIKQEFGDVKVNAITKRQVQAFHNSLHSQGFSNAYCNRFLQLIKSSVNVGINIMEVIDIKNPAVGLALLPEEDRGRFLDSEELGRLLPILIADDGQPAKMARYMLATGIRRGECMNCRWDEIDLKHRVMQISSTRSKSKKADSIPLNDAAIQVLQECDKGTPHPFVNLATGKCYTTISKSFKRLMKEAGLKDVTCHTLRHTAASIMINAGESLYAVQKVLRHSSSAVTEKYAHLSTQSVMAASDTISKQLFRAASGDN
jgi:integrase